MKKNHEIVFGVLCRLFVLVLVGIVVALTTGCATTGGQRGIVNVVNRSDTTMTTLTNGPTNIVSVSNASQQGFIKPRLSLFGFIFGDSPTPTAVPSGYSVQNGQPTQPVIIMESPYPYNPYGYGGGYYGGYRSPYQPVYSGYGSCERRLFGVRFHSR